MADKTLNGIKFPGLGDTFMIPPATKIVKLWQNADWSQPFVAQSFSWDESQNCDAFIITFIYDTGYGYEQSFLTVIYEKMQGCHVCAYFPPKGFDGSITATWRYATVAQTAVTFGKGYRDGTEDAYACIPHTVLGIKW